MKKLTFLLIAALLCTNSFSQTYVWNQKTNFPGGGRFVPFYFSIGNKGYVGCGITFSGSTYEYTHRDFWEYDGALDTWTQLSDFPDTCVSAAAGFVIGGKGYVTTGWTPTAVNTTYEYDPSNNTWTSKANYGGSPRYSTAYFSTDSFAYVGMGYTPLTNDFWRYDPTLDTWTQVASIGGSPRQAASGFSINNYGYVFGGTTALSSVTNELWQYDEANNQWNQKASMPGPGRYGASAFTINGLGYVGLGNNLSFVYNDFYTYNPVNDTWLQIASLGAVGRYGGFAFSFAGAGYVGGGASSNVPTANINDDVWRLELVDANTITGKLFYDYNNNNQFDAGEPLMPNKLITETTTGRVTFSGLNGDYNLAVLDSGNFSVTTDSIGYFSPQPVSHSVYFSGINQIDSLKDFAFQASTLFRDLSVSITPYGNFRPGFDAMYCISYSNLGTNVENPVITLVLDSNLSYVSASETPSYTANDTVVWMLPAINPFQSASFLVTVNVDATTPIGLTVTSPVVIDPIANDINVYNNYSSWGEVVTGSFDPNDIQVNLSEITTTQLTTQPWLEYLIRFQNTGTDTAFNIDVINAVPQGVELSSFELISTSHPVVLRHDPVYNFFGFKFNNILLADSNTNETLSHGFIRYRIKPQTNLLVGDLIENSAAIYFDFNAPVLTNTAETEIVSPTLINNFSNGRDLLTVFPNPAEKSLYLKLPADITPGMLKMISTTGETVFSKSFENKETTQGTVAVQLPKLSQGIYFVRLNTVDGKVFNTKIVIKN